MQLYGIISFLCCAVLLKTLRPVSLLCLTALVLAGCGSWRGDKIDPAGNLSRQDYRALRERPVAPEYQAKPDDGPPIPDLVTPLAAPAMTGTALPLVSLSVTDAVPLRDVLIELARKARVNLELDPRVKGGVIFSAYDQPLDKVMDRLCDLANLRYTLADNTLRVMPDEPYTKEYQLDYLNLNRRSESEVAIATNVFDSDVGSNGTNRSNSSSGNGDNNSTAKVRSMADADFWGEIEKNIASILTNQNTPTSKDKPATPATFSVNRQAGLITVYANNAQQRAVNQFITKAQKMARSQVLIEARIVEVELGDQYRSGINWRTLFDKGLNMAGRFGPTAVGAPFVSAATASDGLFTASYSGSDFSAILNLVREFGATRILSSPRLTVLNNQSAVMKVARNEVYFTTSAQFPTTVTSGGVPVSGTPVFTSMPRTVPVGLVMTVQPVINLDTQEVTLNLRPTISRVVDRVSDPSIGLNAAQNNITAPVDSKIPVLAVREMDSVLRMRSGEVGVMGGLMQDSSVNSDKGVPPFDEMPLVGNIARSRDNNGTVSELVILLRATITDQAQPDGADANLYQKYNNDPRPLIPPPATPADEEPSAAQPHAAVAAPSTTAQTSKRSTLQYQNGRFALRQRGQ